MRHRNIEKEQLVKQKTIEQLVSHGFESFTVNKLAKVCEISIATIYIYYKDKDDLIIKIAREQIELMRQVILRGFNPETSFEEGLRVQWKNRYDYFMENPILGLFFDQLRSSSYQDQVYNGFQDDYQKILDRFMQNAVSRGEVEAMPLEVYWSVAFSPLQSLIRAHYEGSRPGATPFKMTEPFLWQTFDLILKALKK